MLLCLGRMVVRLDISERFEGSLVKHRLKGASRHHRLPSL